MKEARGEREGGSEMGKRERKGDEAKTDIK